MKEIFKDQYYKIIDNIKDGIKAKIDTAKPYLEYIQKVSVSVLLKFTFLLFIVFFAIWFSKFTWRHLTNQKMFLVSPATFSFEIPDWATDGFINEINSIQGLKKKYNIFEKDLTKRIVYAYENSPLVSRVCYVERELPNRLNMKMELRRPVAIVKKRRKEYLVDNDCVRLPDKFYKYPEAGDDPFYIIVRNSVKVPEYGKKWNDKSIIDGINLLNYLRHNKVDKLLKITSIDVSKIGGKHKKGQIDVALLTKDGARIKWGCPTSSEHVNELSNYEKLQNLLSVAMEEGAGLNKMEYVDVRWKTPLAKRVSIR